MPKSINYICSFPVNVEFYHHVYKNLFSLIRNQKQPEEEVENSRTPWLYDQEGDVEKPFIKTGFPVSVEKTTNNNRKNQLDTSRSRRQFDEESLESFSSMPDPLDPTTVTKTFKTRKASAQASLASKDKTPKSKSKKRHSTQLKSRVKNIGKC